eukprot:gene482-607_t
MRPEFSKIYVAAEIKDAIRIMDKYSTGEPDHHGIDLILADADYTTSKLLEHLQKRAEDCKTGRLPIISVIVLMHDHLEVAIKSSIEGNEFMTVAINGQFNASTVFEK